MAEIVERLVKKYYDALEEGKVLGRKCPDCGNVEWPPVYACNACGCMDTEWVEMSGEGEMTVCLVPTVMSAKPQYSDLEPYGYCVVRCKEGPERNVMVLNVSKENKDYICKHLPYPVHMQIVQRDGYKTAVFAIDPILADGTPDKKLIEKRKAALSKKPGTENESAAASEETAAALSDEPAAAPENVSAVNPEIFARLAKIVAEAYKADVSEITPETPFEGKFQVSSVVFVGIVAMIEEEFEVFLSITDAAKNKTVGSLAAVIEKEMEE
jgi:hypothetical protein